MDYFDSATTKEQAKSTWRFWVQKLHPDKGEGGNAKALIELNEQFKTKMAELESNVTESGLDISELGQGLGPTKNGAKCEHCSGKGYTVHVSKTGETCPFCRGRGRARMPILCRSCSGTGTFITKRGFKVKCKTCSGTGVFRWKIVDCPYCFGMGEMWFGPRKEKKTLEKCYKCEGTGEIELFNPVLPKGMIMKGEAKK